MIPKAKALKLIAIYLYICQLHDNELKHLSQRYSNNDEPEFVINMLCNCFLKNYVFTLFSYFNGEKNPD